MEQEKKVYTGFVGHKKVGQGQLTEAVTAVWLAIRCGLEGRVALYDDSLGRTLDIDFAGPLDAVVQRADAHPLVAKPEDAGEKAAGPGRPRLGVVSREVSLLPRHWDWLNDQPSGASAALRLLVDEARKTHKARDMARKAKDAAHKFMWDMAGDLPDFEEASRSFYARDYDTFKRLTASWPTDVRDHAVGLVGKLIPLEIEADKSSNPGA